MNFEITGSHSFVTKAASIVPVFLSGNLAPLLFVSPQQSSRGKGYRRERRDIRATKCLKAEVQWGVKDG